jgi:hypothetical protein
VKRSPPSALVGTWIYEDGKVLDIRADGTGRVRFSTKDREYGYFEWTHVSGEFSVYQYKNAHSLQRSVLHALMDDTPSYRFNVVEITNGEIKISSDTGEELPLTAASNVELESAP